MRNLRWVLLAVLLLFASSARAQSSLSITVHWLDGMRCTCNVTLLQKGVNGAPDTMILNGATDGVGHYSAITALDPTQTYWLTVYSVWYGITLFEGGFINLPFTKLPLKSAALTFVFTRPSVNGVAVPGPGNLPTVYDAPEIAAGTGISFGI